jgi:uncharacterized protein
LPTSPVFFAIPVSERAGNNKFILYRPLNQTAFIGNQAMVDLVQAMLDDPSLVNLRCNEEPVQFLTNIHFFSKQIPPTKPRQSIDTAVLLLTNRCQLNCRYCYAAPAHTNPETLNFSTAKAVIDDVVRVTMRRGQDHFIVDFHGGGEPTLEWELLKKCVEYARSKPLKPSFQLTSNLIWSREQAEYIIENIDHLSVSMDGTPATQDANRPFLAGGGSARIVIGNLKRLDDSRFSYGIRLTATEPWENLAANIRFILENTSCRNIQVEPAFRPADGSDSQPTAWAFEQFSHAFIQAAAMLEPGQASVQFSGSDPTMVRPLFCNALARALIVNPQDNLVSCYEVSYHDHPLAAISIIGSAADEKVAVDLHKKRRLLKMMDERLEKCSRCFCRWSCAGGCYARTFTTGSDGHLNFGAYCRMIQQLTRDALLRLIAANHGVWTGEVQH